MNENWFKTHQQQWQEWQTQWIDTWKDNIPQVKDFPDVTEVFEKTLEVQEEAVKASFRLQHDVVETSTTLQKRCWDTYFDSMRQVPSVASRSGYDR